MTAISTADVIEDGNFLICPMEPKPGEFQCRIKRRDGHHFTIKGSHPHMLFPYADTMLFKDRDAAIANARLIVTQAR